MLVVKIIIGDGFIFILDCDERGVNGKPKIKTLCKKFNISALYFV